MYKVFQLKMASELHVKIRKLAFDNNMSIQKFLIKILEEYTKK